MGNRSLGFDFRPPSSGRTDAANQYENFEYRMIVEGVQKTLASLEKVVPGYKGQGYEIAGFGWFQGHKDSGASKEEYEKHLVNLINDLRKEFKAPKMPVVVATVGFHGYRIVGMTKLESPTSPSGQRAVTVFTFVQNFRPSMPCWLVSPKAERFQPPKV